MKTNSLSKIKLTEVNAQEVDVLWYVAEDKILTGSTQFGRALD